MEVRYYGKAYPTLELPDLMQTQRKFYEDFLQEDIPPKERADDGLEAVLRESFPIESYDEKCSLEYLSYELGAPRYTPDQCRQLGVTYSSPLKVRLRLNRSEPVEELIYIGEVPRMVGGGEFVINGAERVIVTQIQRSPGVDFALEKHASGRLLHTCRIIPERGSWIQVEVTAKDQLAVRVDRSAKIMATTFMRALSEDYGTDAQMLRAFYDTDVVSVTPRTASKLVDAVAVSEVVNSETGEIVLEAGTKLTDFVIENLISLGVNKLEVINDLNDELILNTFNADDAHSHEDAIKRIYARLRPGNPIQLQKAKDFIFERFFDEKRYNFGTIGRFRLCRKFGIKEDEETTLKAKDFHNICMYILKLRAGQGEIDDIDHLENRRVRSIKDLIMDELRKGFLKLRRGVREQMAIKEIDEIQPHQLINSQAVSSSVDYFFQQGELSQVVDQTNPLSQLVHERRLSALGPGGLNRKRAGFEVRDVHTSHYGRICPIETPEGTNIGLIVNLAIYGSINDLGFLVTPYREVKGGKLTGKIIYLRADEETSKYIAQADIAIAENGAIDQDQVIVRFKEDFTTVTPDMVDCMDVSTCQMVGVSASLIPFLEHDDANRALMGSNMQRQAVPLLKPEVPLVGTGMEESVARNSGMVLTAEEDCEVLYADAYKVITTSAEQASGKRIYDLHKYKGLNEGTCFNQRPIVKVGDKLTKGSVLTDGAGTFCGNLALGKNVLVAFLSWEGYNFEDAILVSEKAIKDDFFTSIHVEEFTTEIHETKVGREEITRDIPGVSEHSLRNLDEEGLITIGTKVRPGEILVGKIAPKSKSEYSSEEKLLRAIFGRAGEDIKNDSLDVPPGTEGHVIKVQRFSRKTALTDEQKRNNRKRTKQIESEMQDIVCSEITQKFERLTKIIGKDPVNKRTGRVLRIPRGAEYERLIELNAECEMGELDVPSAKRKQVYAVCLEHDKRIQLLQTKTEVDIGRIKRGDELKPGVIEKVKVYVAVKRKLQIGDKMAGRHGNKGVVARILPEEDMPMLPDGTSVEMVLNPLGVPSRMNVGQILETHLGWAAKTLGFRAVTPVFDGAKEEEVRDALREAGLPETGTQTLVDGRTGEPFHSPTTVGYMYMIKLHHLVAEKIHARATGPYSLITQQPLGGKARNGGQRFGEMEVWALEAYGAASTLQEILTVKSDDVDGRTKIYESMVKGENSLDPGTPVSFEVLCNEIRGLGLNMKLEKDTPFNSED
ncbi:MAG: DNA-directed RNA polymerase subunit beta [Planctomycetota bacterium]|jgi:DNA-directed RNA polymerase subunit beta